VAPDELANLFRVEETVRGGLREAGFASVELDPDGYRGTVA
jgi:PP-loop superfamily ATP-utilizing enzyme